MDWERNTERRHEAACQRQYGDQEKIFSARGAAMQDGWIAFEGRMENLPRDALRLTPCRRPSARQEVRPTDPATGT